MRKLLLWLDLQVFLLLGV